MFDTHAHLEMLDSPVEDVIARARDAGVTRIAAIGSTPESNRFVTGLSDPALIKAVGLDRDQATPDQTEDSLKALISDLSDLIKAVPVSAIGETGLDFHYKTATADQQVALFKAQLGLARELQLPIIVHSREAEADTLACLSEHASAWTGPADRIGVIHCFTGSMDLALKVTHLGYMISFSGILTFKKADEIRDVAAAVPDNQILVETDSPFLAPEPLRGKRNEPSFLPHTVACLAEVRGSTTEDIARITEGNAKKLFGID
jgi:TatD DNase family protein